jgi:chromosome segregation ATPase
MIERLQRQVDQHEDRLDDHLRRLTVVEAEVERGRKRMHRIEGDRAAIQKLVDTTMALAEQTRVLAGEVSAGVRAVEEVAEQAAERALIKAVERGKANRWRLTGRLATNVAALAAAGSLIAYIVHSFL